MSNFIFLCLLFGIVLSEPLILEFQTRNPINESDVMKSLLTNYIYTNFLVGSNKLQMEMNIRSQRGSTFLVSETCPNNIMAFKFKESESDSFSIDTNILYRKYYSYEYGGFLAKDNFILLHNNNKELEIKDYQFMIANSTWGSYQEYLGGMLGLRFQIKENPDTPEETNFIKQLKEKKIINSSVFVLEYEDDSKGKLYIGDYFHKFKESYSENDLISTKAGYKDHKENNWEINVDKIFSGNKIVFKENTYFIIDYEYGILAAPEYYKDEINSSFFNDYLTKNICEIFLRKDEESHVSFKKYRYIVCEKNNFDKSTFPKLRFHSAEMNMSFILTHEDLFYEYKDKIYFLIVFPVYGITVDYWYIGKPLIKKYNLFLDEGNKTIGLYFDFNQYKEEYEEEQKIEEEERQREKALEEQKLQEQEKEKEKEKAKEEQNAQEEENEKKDQEETKVTEKEKDQEEPKVTEKEKDQEETKAQEKEKEKDQEEHKAQEEIKAQEKDQEETKNQEESKDQEKEKEKEEHKDLKTESEQKEEEKEKKNEKDKDDNDKSKTYKILILILGIGFIIVISLLLYYCLVAKKFRKLAEDKAEDNTVEIADSESKKPTNKIVVYSHNS